MEYKSIISLGLLLLTIAPLFVSGKVKEKKMQIFGGKRVSVRDFGFLMQFTVRGRTICGACMISNTWAVTAAHCTDKNRNGVILLAGSDIIGRGLSIPVIKTVQNRLYNSKTFENDVSCLNFRPVSISSTIYPVRLPSSAKVFPPGTVCTVSGFGITETGFQPSNLLATNIQISDQSQCARNYARIGFNVNQDMMLCAGSSTGFNDSCSGDSVSLIRFFIVLYCSF